MCFEGYIIYISLISLSLCQLGVFKDKLKQDNRNKIIEINTSVFILFETKDVIK